MDSVWIFHGEKAQFASGVFTSFEKAEAWIKQYNLSGMLTNYPLNEGVYNWALRLECFEVKKEQHTAPEFIQKFSSASQEHYHYEMGMREGD